MSNYNNVNRVLIGDGTNSGTITSIAGIQKGDLVFFDEKNNAINTVAAAQALARFERITLAAGIGAGLAILSSPIQGNTVSKYEGQTYVAPQEQVAYVGYNGTTGQLEATANTEYRLRILIKDSHRPHGQRSTLMDYNAIVDGGGGQQEVAYKIACAYEQKDYGHNFMHDKVNLERVSDGTRAAFPVGADATVTKGSKSVTFGAAHGLSVGDIVKFQGITYIVDAVPSTTEITLDIKYRGVTETILVADADTGVYTAVSDWGFKLTAIAQSSDITLAGAPLDEYEWVIFDAVYAQADETSTETAALYTLNTAVNPGQGFWKQVAMREEHAKGYHGDTSKRRFHDKRIQSNVVEAQAYDSIVITHADIHGGNFQDTYSAPLKTEIYIPNGSAQADETPGNNEFTAVMNGYFSDVLGFPAISF